MYFRNAVAAIVVYDVTDKFSFEHVDEWVRLIRQNAPADITICLVGNKIDLLDDISVTIGQGKKKAQDLCVGTFAEVSAKENLGLDEMMNALAAKVFLV